MKNRFCFRLVAAILAVSFFGALPLMAQPSAEDNFRGIAQKLIARRESAMSTLIQMNDDEKKKFYAVKKAYDKKLRAIYNDRMALAREFGEIHDKLTQENALAVMRSAVALDRRRTDLHEEYFTKMAEEVSAVVAAQWIQLQTQFEGLADVKLTERVPLAMP